MDRASRRDLLRGGTVALGALAAGCGRAPRPRPADALRPPGARPGREFLALCIRCGRCGLVCAAGCIRFDDHLGADGATPYLVPTERACNLCMACGQACPTGALEPLPVDLARAADRVRMGTAVIDQARCWTWSERGICRACWYACPLADAAIALDGPGLAPRIDEARCIGCGLCAQACPPAARAVAIRPRRS